MPRRLLRLWLGKDEVLLNPWEMVDGSDLAAFFYPFQGDVSADLDTAFERLTRPRRKSWLATAVLDE